MKRLVKIVFFSMLAIIVASCSEKKKHDDIIAPKAEKPKLQAPIRMQDYNQTTDVKWLDKNYQVVVSRTPDDSLRMVKDETGQKYVDNRISLKIIRPDGSVFFSRTFTKAAFDSFLNDDYRKTGILEGLVFDKVEGNNLFFAASVKVPFGQHQMSFEKSRVNFQCLFKAFSGFATSALIQSLLSLFI